MHGRSVHVNCKQSAVERSAPHASCHATGRPASAYLPTYLCWRLQASCESSFRDCDLLMSEGHHHDILIVGVCRAEGQFGMFNRFSHFINLNLFKLILQERLKQPTRLYKGISTETSDGQICALLMSRMGGPVRTLERTWLNKLSCNFTTWTKRARNEEKSGLLCKN